MLEDSQMEFSTKPNHRRRKRCKIDIRKTKASKHRLATADNFSQRGSLFDQFINNTLYINEKQNRHRRPFCGT